MKIYNIQKITDTNQRRKIESLAAYMTASQVVDTDEFAVVANPQGSFPEFELYPLATAPHKTIDSLAAILSDMDGTTTTTETLCLHSLEMMVRDISLTHDGSPSVKTLNEEEDYPHIIGNSTTKHVEYLLKKYRAHINHRSLMKAFVRAALWTMKFSVDPGRQNEVSHNLSLLGIAPLLTEQANSITYSFDDDDALNKHAQTIITQISLSPNHDDDLLVTKLAVDIYYLYYHSILAKISQGDSAELEQKLTNGNRLIEPMPGVAQFLALITGYLGSDAHRVFTCEDERQARRVNQLGTYFQTNPAKVAIVTSSIFYEADIVLSEVFSILRQQVALWDIEPKKRLMIINKFDDYRLFYDAVVTASDANEIRLKPHRDLYSIAIRKLSIPREKLDQCIGIEDSESGLIAIRAAGVAYAVGIPFEATKGHNLQMAHTLLNKGLSDLVLTHSCFLNNK